MQVKNFRCQCPTTSAIDVLGDRWSLVIIKQMLFELKSTFKQFSESDEAIASNMLTTRLKKLEEFGIISKYKLPNNQKTVHYELTKKGLALGPTLIELSVWSQEHLKENHPNLNLVEINLDNSTLKNQVEQKYRDFHSTQKQGLSF
ncbi:MAG: winged helix-turn-helix transcriptional regulator [Flavobacteriaceae bacterium]